MELLPRVLLLLTERTFQQAFTAAHTERLAGSCRIVRPAPCTSLARADSLQDVEIVVTGWGTPRLDEATVAALPALRLIAHVGGTVKPLVDPGVLGSSVRITSAVAANARPVAEFALAFILLENKNVAEWVRQYRARRSRLVLGPHSASGTMGNAGKTVGVVGASRVGRCLLHLLRAFDLRPLVHDPYLSAGDASALGAEPCSLHDLLRRSDVVTLHAPSLPATRHMIGASELAMMRDGSLLINTARGEILDHDALVAELRDGRLRAILDVTDPEPLPDSSPFFDLPNVILTPHVAGSLGVEIHRMTELILTEIERFIGTGTLAHEIRREDWATMA
ncbi:MAG: hydroxyacid dehydrogenase [Geminicoccaceae bacterium]|mgnify:CR=1 FL=1|jgi:phosphoglycerate dehydrogenase-like enzyme|nr:hydroxyacid dehydrogenase [Geminicoccaceae bacterium]HRY23013.1 hydroxyacid dehydrogenase [Geminicoccaceae bacterium]